MSDADSIVSKLLNLSEEGKAKLDALLDEGMRDEFAKRLNQGNADQ